MSKTGAFLLLIALALAGCGDPAPSVVLYVSADEYVARQVIDKFERKTGIDVQLVTDAEASKTTGLVERLRAEQDNPQADVFWSSEVFMTIDLAAESVLEAYESAATAEWPEAWRDPDSHWYAFGGRARVIVYSPERVRVDEVPQTWMALTQPQWKGRIVMADPRFGTTGGHLGAMRWYWDRWVMPGFYMAWLEGLAANEVRMLPSGNAGVVAAVAGGEADIGLTDTDDVWAAKAQGMQVHLVYPAHDRDVDLPGKGTLVIPNTVARVRGGPNPVEAGQLIDFLISEEVERMLAESDSHNIPLRPGLSSDYEEYEVASPLDVNYAQAAAMRQAAVDAAMRMLQDSK